MLAWLHGAWAALAGFQRDVLLAEVATTLRAFAASGYWGLLVVLAPWALLVGPAHALTAWPAPPSPSAPPSKLPMAPRPRPN